MNDRSVNSPEMSSLAVDEKPYCIRLAKHEDIDALTDLHMKSFRPSEHVPVMLGKKYVRATYRWQIDGDSAYVLLAEEANKIIGLIGVCDGFFTGRMFKACLPEFLLSLARNPLLLLTKKLWERLFWRLDTNKRSGQIVKTLGFAQMTIGAVDEKYRGKGVFPELVEASKKYSRERGSRAIRAGVYKNNMSSRRVFIKGNWLEISKLETADTVHYVFFIDPEFQKEMGI